MTWRTQHDLEGLRPGRVNVRCTERCAVYQAANEQGDDAVLVAMFEGAATLRITQPYVRIDTEGDFWWQDRTIDQTVERSSDVVYTSLDRPSPLSPEMLAIQQMVKRNQIERDQTLEQMQRLHDATLQLRNGAATPPKVSKKQADDSSHSKTGEKGAPSPDGAADSEPDGTPTGGKSGTGDPSEKGQQSGGE